MLHPGDSRTTLMAAKVARAKGESARARGLLEQAAAQRAQEARQLPERSRAH